MPVHPTEENAPSHIFDKVAKESDNSTASTHPLHRENEGPVKASGEHHQSKGPQLSDKLPSVQGTKDDLAAKAKEMNK